jgi:hypothetical protein
MKQPRPFYIAIVLVVLIPVIGYMALVASVQHKKDREEREWREGREVTERGWKEMEDLGRQIARTELRLFEGRNSRNGAGGHPSEMVTALAAIGDPDARIKPGSELDMWLRRRFKRSGRFSADEVRQAAEEEVDGEMRSLATDVPFFMGLIDQGRADLREGGEDGLIPVFDREVQRLYPNEYFEACRSLADRLLEEMKH